MLLTGPSLASKQGVSLRKIDGGAARRLTVPPFAAALYTLSS